MFLTYFCMLAFSLRTHKDLFRGAEEREGTERQWSRSNAVIILLVATAFVALLSEFLVGTIESVRDSVGLTEVFVGVIVVAIVVSVYILFQISSDGETNWIEGIQLLSLYLILGILFFYLPEPAHAAP